MPNYAILDLNNKEVVNVIVSHSKEQAESISGRTAIPTANTGEQLNSEKPGIGWTLEDDGWRPPSPFRSWIWDGEEWQAPYPKPVEVNNGFYVQWNEDLEIWQEIEIPQPYPSWIKNEENIWVAPVPRPYGGHDYRWDESEQDWYIYTNKEDFISEFVI